MCEGTNLSSAPQALIVSSPADKFSRRQGRRFMASNTLRSAVVLVLLFGTLALAVPFVSGAIDAWLFTDPSDTVQSKWKTQRPAAREPKELQPAAPKRLPTARQSSYEPSAEEIEDVAPFAFDFQENP